MLDWLILHAQEPHGCESIFANVGIAYPQKFQKTKLPFLTLSALNAPNTKETNWPYAGALKMLYWSYVFILQIQILDKARELIFFFYLFTLLQPYNQTIHNWVTYLIQLLGYSFIFIFINFINVMTYAEMLQTPKTRIIDS